MTWSYTDDELLDALREFAVDHDGRPPTVPEANNHETLPSATAFIYHFDTWNAAVEAAGLDTRNRGQSEADRADGLDGTGESAEISRRMTPRLLPVRPGGTVQSGGERRLVLCEKPQSFELVVGKIFHFSDNSAVEISLAVKPQK